MPRGHVPAGGPGLRTGEQGAGRLAATISSPRLRMAITTLAPRARHPRRAAGLLPHAGRHRASRASSSACSARSSPSGMALIYRANRILNFAQGDLGAVPTVLAVALVGLRRAQLLPGRSPSAWPGRSARRRRRAGHHPALLQRAAPDPHRRHHRPRRSCSPSARCSSRRSGASGRRPTRCTSRSRSAFTIDPHRLLGRPPRRPGGGPARAARRGALPRVHRTSASPCGPAPSGADRAALLGVPVKRLQTRGVGGGRGALVHRRLPAGRHPRPARRRRRSSLTVLARRVRRADARAAHRPAGHHRRRPWPSASSSRASSGTTPATPSSSTRSSPS